MTSWISVDDRLPENRGYYTAWHAAWDCPSSAWFTGNGWRQWDAQIWLDYDYSDIEVVVSHWQPLPEPPEVTNGD